MSRIVTKGATSQSVYVEILDSTSTTGGRKTGLVYNTAGMTAYYVRGGGSAVAITLATLAAANSAWSSGGFKEVDATNMPGIYRLDVPDAAFASGADSVVVTIKGATGAAQVSSECQLIGANLQDTVRAGLTALPNAAAEAAGGLYTRGSGAGQINQPANGMVDANVVRNAGTAITAAAGIQEVKVASVAANAIDAGAIAADAIGSSELAASAANEIADAILDRDMSTGADSGSTTVRTVRQALRFLRNKWAIAGGTLTVYKEDDATSSWTSAVTTDGAANPVVSNDPAGP